MTEVIGSLILGTVLEAIFLYVLDEKLGCRPYAWWYNLTHKEPLPGGVKRGFIYGQKADRKFSAAVLIALLQNGLGFWLGYLNPVYAMFAIVLEVPSLVIGFYMGFAIMKFFERRRGAIQSLGEVVDKLESGDTTVTAEIKKVADTIQHQVHEVLSRDDVSSPQKPKPVSVSEEAVDTTVKPEPHDPLKAINDFTRGR